jgi:hypothetical protein
VLACRGERDHVQRRLRIALVPVGGDLVETLEDPGQ